MPIIFLVFLTLFFIWIFAFIWTHFFKVKKCLTKKEKENLSGQTVIITGANSGIGLETSREFYRRGARVLMACRDKDRAEKAKNNIISTNEKNNKKTDGDLIVYQLDLSSLQSVHKFCNEIKKNETRVNILVTNAGIYNHPPESTRDEGLEIHMCVNHLGHFLLINLLLDILKSSAPSRIVVLGSYLYSYGNINFKNLIKGPQSINPNSTQAYMDSKLANALFVHQFHSEYGPDSSGVSIYYADPGIVLTNIDRYTIPRFIQPFVHFLLSAIFLFPHEANQTILHCALSDDIQVKTGSGCYFSNCSKKQWNSKIMEKGLAKKFWETSEDLTGVRFSKTDTNSEKEN